MGLTTFSLRSNVAFFSCRRNGSESNGASHAKKCLAFLASPWVSKESDSSHSKSVRYFLLASFPPLVLALKRLLETAIDLTVSISGRNVVWMRSVNCNRSSYCSTHQLLYTNHPQPGMYIIGAPAPSPSEKKIQSRDAESFGVVGDGPCRPRMYRSKSPGFGISTLLGRNSWSSLVIDGVA